MASDVPCDLVREALLAMLPPGAVCEVATPNDEVDALLPEERAHTSGMAAVRRAEFSTGRRLARAALERLGFESRPLLPAADRAPQWPPGAIGSISHTRALCAVVVARAGALRSLGLDIEATGRVEARLWDALFTAREQTRLRALPADARARVATTAFGAKECFYKWQRPLTRRFLGPLEVEVDVEPGPGTAVASPTDAGRFAIHAPPDLGLPGGAPPVGRWRLAGGHSVALMAD